MSTKGKQVILILMGALFFMAAPAVAKAAVTDGNIEYSQETNQTGPVQETDVTAPVQETDVTAPVQETDVTDPVQEAERTDPAPQAAQNLSSEEKEKEANAPAGLEETDSNVPEERATADTEDVLRISEEKKEAGKAAASVPDPVTVRVSLHANGGKRPSTTKKEIKLCWKGSSGSWQEKKMGKLPTASRKGYRFIGWYSKKTGGRKITSATLVSQDNAKGLDLYAHWKKIRVKKARISQVLSSAGHFSVRYDRVKGAKGYELRYSLNPDMSGSKKVWLSSKQTSLSVDKGQYGIYFVEVRAYQLDPQGNRVYGKWSNYRLGAYTKYNTGISESTMRHAIRHVESDANKKAVLYAFSRVGYPYSQAMRTSGSHYDCSSLAYYSWKGAGVSLTRGVSETAAIEAQSLEAKGKKVNISRMQPGSLMFHSSHRNGRYKNITHVAVYVGQGMVVEAANPRRGVVYRSMYTPGRGGLVLCANPGKKAKTA